MEIKFEAMAVLCLARLAEPVLVQRAWALQNSALRRNGLFIEVLQRLTYVLVVQKGWGGVLRVFLHVPLRIPCGAVVCKEVHIVLALQSTHATM